MKTEDSLKTYLQDLKDSGLYRARAIYLSDGNRIINFSSNDYLSLANDPKLSEIYQEAYRSYPVSSSASMLLCGYQQIHREVEQAFAQFLAVDDALIFSSGYAANLAVCNLLKKINVTVLIDKGLHASFYDGLQLAGLNFSRFRHQDLSNFLIKLQALPLGSISITEGIFSMSGQQAELPAMAELCLKQQGQLLVDEAHSFGVLGHEGRGAVHFAALDQEIVPLRIIPLGKAFASQGAIVAGAAQWIDALVQAGRSYIYSTGISPALAGAWLKTLELIQGAYARREKLQALISFFCEQVKASSLNWTDSQTAVQQLRLGSVNKARRFSDELKKQGFLCLPIRPPTVTLQDSGLRVILNVHHKPEQIQRLFDCLHQIHYENTDH